MEHITLSMIRFTLAQRLATYAFARGYRAQVLNETEIRLSIKNSKNQRYSIHVDSWAALLNALGEV